MRIAVTGTNGQLARSLAERISSLSDIDLVCLGRPDVDLASPETIGPALGASGADLIINAAAYTKVDEAERDSDTAFTINAAGAGAVALAAAQLDMPVIQISTDYVFDGTATAPYPESAQTNPVSVYGASKLAGEAAVAASNPRHLIIRTAWVYSPFGKNFVKTMLRLASECDTLPVVDDQTGNPTSALDLADGLLAAAPLVLRPGFADWGVYNISGSGSTTWAGFAAHIFEESHRVGGPRANIKPVSGSEFITQAKRPSNSCLTSTKVEKILGYRAPDWRLSASTVVRRLLADGPLV